MVGSSILIGEDTAAVPKAVDQWESPERNKIENDIKKTRREAGFLLYFSCRAHSSAGRAFD